MKQLRPLIQPVAPALYAALGGPFSGVAIRYIKNHLAVGSVSDGRSNEDVICDLLEDTHNLQKIKNLDQSFRLEMQKLDVDIFSFEKPAANPSVSAKDKRVSPQIVLSVLFLVSYFGMLAAIFVIEVSDTLNMKSGENSLMGELQILFGVLTAGVGQILSYWFGSALGKKDAG